MCSVATFDAFYRERYAPIVRALSYVLYDVELAREAVDEAMVRAYARWPKISGYDDPSGWVYRVALNWARDVRRRARHARRHRVPDHVAEPEPVDPRVHAALRALDVDQRAVVVCRLLLDWSVEKTATALGVKQGTVKSRLSRALGRLERVLGEEVP